MKQWFELEVEKPADLTDLSGGAHTKGWKFAFIQDPEDYLLCGTGVLGSCISVYGQSSEMPSLMGIAMQGKARQGKNRLLALKSRDERIQARVILRLGIDPIGKALVRHMDQPYEQVGLPKGYLSQMCKFALEIAERIGVTLVSNVSEFTNDKQYPNLLRFYPDSALTEHVDAGEIGTAWGKTGFSIKGAHYVEVNT